MRLAGVAAFEFAVVVVGFNDCPGIAYVQLGEGHEECEGVVEPSYDEHALAVFHWQILVEQEEAVAEIEIGFTRIALPPPRWNTSLAVTMRTALPLR